MPKLSIRDLPLSDHHIFMRVDFNVPLDDGRVIDDTRIRETLPTTEHAFRHGGRLILASHLGRPKGKPNPKMSLKPVAERLRMMLDRDLARGENVGFCPECVGPEAEEMALKLEKGQTLLLENLRFHAEEEANDENFSKQLAKLADFYVNDAFGTAHRAHASTVGITKFVQKSAAGLLMEKVLEFLFHQQAGRRLLYKFCDSHSGGVRPVRCSERIINVVVGQARQLLGKFCIVGFLFGMKAQILEQQT